MQKIEIMHLEKIRNLKQNKKLSENSTISKIAKLADDKKQNESDDEIYDKYNKPEYYLKQNKKVSNNRFTEIDCLSRHQLVPLKEKVISNPTNQAIKMKFFRNKIRRNNLGKKWYIELKLGFNLLFFGVGFLLIFSMRYLNSTIIFLFIFFFLVYHHMYDVLIVLHGV